MVSPVSFGMTIYRAQSIAHSPKSPQAQSSLQGTSQTLHKPDLFFQGGDKTSAKSYDPTAELAQLKAEAQQLKTQIASAGLTIKKRDELTRKAKELKTKVKQLQTQMATIKHHELKNIVSQLKTETQQLKEEITEANFTPEKIEALKRERDALQSRLDDKTVKMSDEVRGIQATRLAELKSEIVDGIIARKDKTDTRSAREILQSRLADVRSGKRGIDDIDSKFIQSTLLHDAATFGDLDAVKQAVALDADLEATDVLGFTALHRAIQRNERTIDSDGKVHNSHMPVINLLLSSGANPNASNGTKGNMGHNMGVSVLYEAKSRNFKEIARALEKKGGEVFTQEEDLSHYAPVLPTLKYVLQPKTPKGKAKYIKPIIPEPQRTSLISHPEYWRSISEFRDELSS